MWLITPTFLKSGTPPPLYSPKTPSGSPPPIHH